jgi:hypothetical protein
MSKFDNIEIDKFKTWLESNSNKEPANVGVAVDSKITYKKLLEKIDVESDDKLEIIAKSFKRYGGTIVKVNNDLLTIKTEKGAFDISKIYVKTRD